MNDKIKILIVEDEAIIAMALKMHLQKLKFNIIKPVTTGEDAITITHKENPDIILMDVHLNSKMDGISAAEEIRSFSNAYIFIMSGNKEEEERERVKKITLSSYIIKPVRIEEIEEIIMTTVRKM